MIDSNTESCQSKYNIENKEIIIPCLALVGRDNVIISSYTVILKQDDKIDNEFTVKEVVNNNRKAPQTCMSYYHVITQQLNIDCLSNTINNDLKSLSLHYNEIKSNFIIFAIENNLLNSNRRSIIRYQGQGFDAYTPPSIAEMANTINKGRYSVVGLYMPGSQNQATKWNQAEITTLAQQGWKFIPTFVGLQAPCYTKHPLNKMSYDSQTAYQQGRQQAQEALNVAQNLGLRPKPSGDGVVIYFDLEQYDKGNFNCHRAAKSFVSGWSQKIHETGNMSGLYSSASGINDFASLSDSPDFIWFADKERGSYDPNRTVWRMSGDTWHVSDNVWNQHQRIFQYALDVPGNSNGVNSGRNIDINVIDGAVVSLFDVITTSTTSEMTTLNNIKVMNNINDPNDQLTRYEAWIMVFRTMDYINSNGSSSNENNINNTIQLEITNKKHPSNLVTRQELLTMFIGALEAHGYNTSTVRSVPYNDMPSHNNFNQAIKKAYNADIIGNHLTITPNESVRRHRFAKWAIKFKSKLPKLSANNTLSTTVLDGIASLIDPKTINCWGCDRDQANMQRHSGLSSTVLFQWRNQNNLCKYIRLEAKGLDKATVFNKQWSNPSVEKIYKISGFPVTIPNRGEYTTTAISSFGSLKQDTIKVFAYCTSSDSHANKREVFDTNIDLTFSNGYSWAGNGSVISKDSRCASDDPFGCTKDLADTHQNKSSLTGFQWQVSSNCKKLTIDTRINRNFNGKLKIKEWDAITWSSLGNKSFPLTLDKSSSGSYYVIAVETEAGAVLSDDYIQASCSQ